MSTTVLKQGSVLGAFELLEHLGEGGMGSVWKARNRISGDLRAIKVILPELANDPEFVNRFVREIRIAAHVSHPNLVRVLEPSMHGNVMFLPMELLQGETVASRLNRKGRLHYTEALSILVPVCRGVAAMHEAGIMHRDLKPANIFLARDENNRETPKILDFGAARPVETDAEQTAFGTIVGSPHYMPVEQARGQRDLDFRVDQYAVGVIAYLLVTGVRPYENDDSGMALAKVLQGAPFRRPREIVPSIPPGLEQVILRAMARDRNQRFPAVAELEAAFKAFAVDDDEEEVTAMALKDEEMVNLTQAGAQRAPPDAMTMALDTMAGGPAGSVSMTVPAKGLVQTARTGNHPAQPAPPVRASQPGFGAVRPSQAAMPAARVSSAPPAPGRPSQTNVPPARPSQSNVPAARHSHASMPTARSQAGVPAPRPGPNNSPAGYPPGPGPVGMSASLPYAPTAQLPATYPPRFQDSLSNQTTAPQNQRGPSYPGAQGIARATPTGATITRSPVEVQRTAGSMNPRLLIIGVLLAVGLGSILTALAMRSRTPAAPVAATAPAPVLPPVAMQPTPVPTPVVVPAPQVVPPPAPAPAPAPAPEPTPAAAVAPAPVAPPAPVVAPEPAPEPAVAAAPEPEPEPQHGSRPQRRPARARPARRAAPRRAGRCVPRPGVPCLP